MMPFSFRISAICCVDEPDGISTSTMRSDLLKPVESMMYMIKKYASVTASASTHAV